MIPTPTNVPIVEELRTILSGPNDLNVLNGLNSLNGIKNENRRSKTTPT